MEKDTGMVGGSETLELFKVRKNYAGKLEILSTVGTKKANSYYFNGHSEVVSYNKRKSFSDVVKLTSMGIVRFNRHDALVAFIKSQESGIESDLQRIEMRKYDIEAARTLLETE